MKWGAFAIIEPFAIWGLSQKREVTHSYLVAHTLHLWASLLRGYRREARRKGAVKRRTPPAILPLWPHQERLYPAP